MVPSWLYRKCEISQEELASIQFELGLIIDRLVPNYATIRGQFTRADVNLIRSSSPALVEFLKRINLLDRWTDASIITANSNHPFRWPVHIDDASFGRCIALNIPLMNCDDTYTAWYNATDPITSSADPSSLKGESKASSLYYSDENAVEIARMPANQCAFINVAVPHRPVVTHSRPRVMLSNRFSPELFDYFG